MSVALLSEPNMASLGLTEAQLAVIRAAEGAYDFTDETIGHCGSVDALSALVVVMSDISEEGYCAGWMTGLGHDMRAIVAKHGRTGPDARYGMDKVSAAQRDTMAALAEKAGGWPEYEEPGTPFVLLPLETP